MLVYEKLMFSEKVGVFEKFDVFEKCPPTTMQVVW